VYEGSWSEIKKRRERFVGKSIRHLRITVQTSGDTRRQMLDETNHGNNLLMSHGSIPVYPDACRKITRRRKPPRAPSVLAFPVSGSLTNAISPLDSPRNFILIFFFLFPQVLVGRCSISLLMIYHPIRFGPLASPTQNPHIAAHHTIPGMDRFWFLVGCWVGSALEVEELVELARGE
jgi:hypothetical protein